MRVNEKTIYHFTDDTTRDFNDTYKFMFVMFYFSKDRHCVLHFVVQFILFEETLLCYFELVQSTETGAPKFLLTIAPENLR